MATVRSPNSFAARKIRIAASPRFAAIILRSEMLRYGASLRTKEYWPDGIGESEYRPLCFCFVFAEVVVLVASCSIGPQCSEMRLDVRVWLSSQRRTLAR